mgnify:CR=1 FL=1
MIYTNEMHSQHRKDAIIKKNAKKDEKRRIQEINFNINYQNDFQDHANCFIWLFK